MELSAKDKAEIQDKLLGVLADMVTMPIPQQAMVWSNMIGSFVAATMAQKRMSERKRAVDFILDQMESTIRMVRPH